MFCETSRSHRRIDESAPPDSKLSGVRLGYSYQCVHDSLAYYLPSNLSMVRQFTPAGCAQIFGCSASPCALVFRPALSSSLMARLSKRTSGVGCKAWRSRVYSACSNAATPRKPKVRLSKSEFMHQSIDIVATRPSLVVMMLKARSFWSTTIATGGVSGVCPLAPLSVPAHNLESYTPQSLIMLVKAKLMCLRFIDAGRISRSRRMARIEVNPQRSSVPQHQLCVVKAR